MIFEVITSRAAAGQMNFTAANPPPNGIAVNGAGAGVPLENPLASQWFERGDNLKLRKLWVSVPYGFGWGVGPLQIQFEFRNSANAPIGIPEFCNSGWLFVPNPCDGIEFPDGLFLRAPVDSTLGRFRMVISAFIGNVSVVNLPASLVGESIKVELSIALEHTRGMAGVP